MGALLVLTGIAFLTGWITDRVVLAAGDVSRAGAAGLTGARGGQALTSRDEFETPAVAAASSLGPVSHSAFAAAPRC